MSSANIVLMVAYVAYLLSPALRDEFHLRTALLVTSFVFVYWGFLIEDGWVVIVANALFAIIGLRHVVRLYSQRRPVALTDDQEAVRAGVFDSMSGRDFLLLWHLGRSELLAPGSTIIDKGRTLEDVLVVTSGNVIIDAASGAVRRIAPVLLGEMSYVLGDDAAATATVRCDGQVEVRRWAKSTLKDLQRSHPDLAVAFLRSVGTNLAGKIT